MSWFFWRRLTGHSLVCAWLLWQGLDVWIGPTRSPSPGEDAEIVNTYESKDDCLKAAITKRNTRNAILRQNKSQDQVGIEKWACLPVGAPPEKAHFD
jgi:hypothetical protein